MEMRELVEEIKNLHREIEEECNKKLEILDRCSEAGGECRECSWESRCRLDMSKVAKVSQLYSELNSREGSE